MTIELHHVAVPVNNLESAARFYTDVLWLKPIERPDSLPNSGVWLEGHENPPDRKRELSWLWVS